MDVAPHPRVRAPLAIVGSVLTFALLIETAGLIPAVTLTIVIASLGSRQIRMRQAWWLAICVALAMAVVFVGLLGQPFTLIVGL